MVVVMDCRGATALQVGADGPCCWRARLPNTLCMCGRLGCPGFLRGVDPWRFQELQGSVTSLASFLTLLQCEPWSLPPLACVDVCHLAMLQASKLVRLMRNVGLTLNRYYPGRLYQLFFVEPPAVMKWPIQAAKPLLHPNTGNKIHICAADDPALPFPI